MKPADGFQNAAEASAFAFTVAPTYYYSNAEQIAKFDFESNFGVEYGSQTFMNEVVKDPNKIGVPVGAGPYAASKASGGIENISSSDFYSLGIIYFERNPYYIMGPATIKKIRYQVVSSATQSVELTELLPDMLYLLYVTTDCGSGESAHTTTISFRTECAPESAPWSEDFTTSVTTSQCWSSEVGTLSENVVFTGSTSDWYTSQDAIGGNTTGKVYNNIII